MLLTELIDRARNDGSYGLATLIESRSREAREILENDGWGPRHIDLALGTIMGREVAWYEDDPCWTRLGFIGCRPAGKDNPRGELAYYSSRFKRMHCQCMEDLYSVISSTSEGTILFDFKPRDIAVLHDRYR